MDNSILNTIKKMLGMGVEFTEFDTDIIVHINTVLATLRQLGIRKVFSITSSDETWADYLEDAQDLEMVKSYIYMKVKMMFDPPTGALKDSLESQIKELEFRINVAVDSKDTFVD